MRLLRNYLDKILLVLILMILWILLCSVLVEKRIKRKNRPLKEKKDLVLPILVMVCNELFIKRSIETLTRFRWHKDVFPIILTLDCYSNKTLEVIKPYTASDPTITYIVVPKLNPGLGRHYKFALNHVFKTLQYKAAIVLDDDLDISPDFYEYFLATYHLFDKDPSIWCVSAWNDNCKEGLVENEVAMLHRTDYFPGKGWMIRSKTWTEIEPHLPEPFFDVLMKNAVITRGRVCIRPEISRTYNFREIRASDGKTHDRHHRNRRQRLINTDFVPFTKYDLSYLLLEQEYLFVAFVYSCPETTVKDLMSGINNSSLKFVRIPYSDVRMFREIAKTFGLMDDFDHEVFPTALHGIVQCFFRGRRVFLAPTRMATYKPKYNR